MRGGKSVSFIGDDKKVSMQMSIHDPQDRVWSLHMDYVQALRAGGYGYLPDAKPHIIGDHILSKLKPQSFRTRMKYIITCRKDERFHKKNFNIFMLEVAKQAKK